MKKKFGMKVLLPILIAVALVLPMFVIGKDYEAEYDKIFGNGEFTISTNGITEGNIEQWQLQSVVQRFVGNYTSTTIYEGDNQYYYTSQVPECNVDDMNCDIVVYKNTVVDGVHSSEEFKKYEDVSININTDVSSYFSEFIDEDGNLVIKYDESMFANEEEKYEYIGRYFSSYYHSNEYGYNVSYEYDRFSNSIFYRVIDYTNYNFENYFIASTMVNDIIFDSTEEPYSSDFENLTVDGNLTIKTNGDITVTILSQYLNAFSSSSSNGWFHFSVDGNIVDDKVYINMVKNDSDGKKVAEEKHLVTLIKDSNVDRAIFASIGWDGVIEIAADEPESEINSYISNYMYSVQQTYVDVDENTHYYFSYIAPDFYSNDYFIKSEKYVNDNIVEVQFNQVSFDFTGYSDIYSENFESKYGNGMVVRSDETSISAVNSNLNYNYRVLSCNEDISVCDIALYHSEDRSVEIHKVNITFDNSISEQFRELFAIKDDGTIDILSDTDFDDNNYFSYYTYDQDLEISMNYYRNGNKIDLNLNPWSGNGFEKHSVPYNIVNGGPTPYYLNRVDLTKDFYPGENTDVWKQLTWNGYFAKTLRDSYGVNTLSCDRNTNKCKVMLLNNNKMLEVHETTANIKTGKSPEFSASFPSDKVKINAVYKDNEEYLYDASMAYFMSQTKDYVYLRDFTANSAKVVFNELEIHSFDVEYTNSNEKHAKEIEDAKNRLKEVDLTTERRDLDFINYFYYYDEDNLLSSDNFNSKSLNDQFKKAVKNNHIGYYVVPGGGGGDLYLSGAGGRMVLFYDGVAYDALDGYVDFTNYNIVYIPSNTEKTPQAYAAAAQARVDEYLGENSGVIITYDGPVEEGYFDDESQFEVYDIDKNNFDYNNYKISYLNKENNMLIIADSSKMQKPDFAAFDVTNNISVTSETVNYPSNTVVMSDVIDSEDSKYSEILDKAKVKNAHIVDINLYSSSVGDIDDFDGANFDVSVPIKDETLFDKDLIAYYIDDEGNIEQHPVVMDGFMANFETTHFSTYIIAEKSTSDKIEDAAQDVVKNPNTLDNVLTSVLLLIVSGLGIGVYCYEFVKREN